MVMPVHLGSSLGLRQCLTDLRKAVGDSSAPHAHRMPLPRRRGT